MIACVVGKNTVYIASCSGIMWWAQLCFSLDKQSPLCIQYFICFCIVIKLEKYFEVETSYIYLG